MKKKIVFAINYFYPDVASTGQLMTELCLELQRDFRITVIVAAPEGAEFAGKSLFRHDRLEDIRIVRLKLPKLNKRSKWSRIRYVAAYFLLALAALLRERGTDAIFTISTPPVLGGLIGAIGKRLKGSLHLYNVQDFNPEQAEAIGYARGKAIYRLARGLDNWTCRTADHVVVVGRDMKMTLAARLDGARLPAHSVIPNWVDEEEIVPLGRDHPEVERFRLAHGIQDRFVVMYSGNIGLYYDLENLFDTVERYRGRPDVRFVFIGDGAVRPDLERRAKESGMDNVLFLPYQPKARLKITLNAADVHLVVSQKGIKGVSVPSKIYGVMAAGKPVIGVLEKGSEAETIITASGCGAIVEPRDYAAFDAAVDAFSRKSPDELARMGLQGRAYLDKHLRKRASIEKYGRLLAGMINQERGHSDDGFGHRRDQGQSGGIDPFPGIAAESNATTR